MPTAIRWELLVPWVLSFVGIMIGIWQYADKSAQSNREPFLRKQLELCFEASDVAATLSVERDPAEWAKLGTRFWRLYWGNLAIVEDPAVEAAMVRFGRELEQVGEQPVLPAGRLSVHSLRLSLAIRELILKSWGVDIEPLRAKQG